MTCIVETTVCVQQSLKQLSIYYTSVSKTLIQQTKTHFLMLVASPGYLETTHRTL